MSKAVIVIGDSIAFGYGDSRGGWVSRFREEFDKFDLFTKNYPYVFNLGIPGENTEKLLIRLDDEIKARSRQEGNVIIIEVGKNDCRFLISKNKNDVSLDDYEKNLDRIIQIASKYSEDLVFIGLAPIDEAKTNPVYWNTDKCFNNKTIKEYDSVLKKVCQLRGIEYIDIYSRFEELGPLNLISDGLHPNEKGYQVITKEVLGLLKKKKIIKA